MSTKTEPYRKYVAHDEKSKFFIFFPEIAYGKPRNAVRFFSSNMLLKARKKIKNPLRSHGWSKTRKIQ